MTNAIEIVRSNIEIYKDKAALDKELGLVCNFMVEKILIPGLTAISAAYGINMNWHMEAQ
jgi:hypothetical protein